MRGSLVDLYVEFTAQAVYDDVKVKLSHSADDGLAGFLVSLHAEGRVFLGKFSKGNSKFVQILLGLWLHGDSDNRFREFHRLQGNLMALCTNCIACAQVLEADCRTDVSRLHEIYGILVVGVHLIQP